jgi:hypothetical protein
VKYWEQIRKARSDLTEYVIHWTKGKHENGKWVKPLDILTLIIKCGYLIPGFSKKTSIYNNTGIGTGRPTIRGPFPADCFTEQSFEQFAKSCEILPSHYCPYGFALYKRALYRYGGRPVIYCSEKISDI